MSQLTKIIQEANAASYNRVPNDNIIKWCERNLVTSAAHGEEGPVRLAGSRYLHEPLLAFADRSVKQETIVAGVQTGKTLIAEMCLCWQLVNRPGSIQWFAQTDTKSEEEMLSRLKPMMLQAKALRPLLPSDPRKIRADGVRTTSFDFSITGHSPADIQSSTRHLVIVDELAHYDSETTLEEIKNRTIYTEEQGNSKVLIISQAGLRDNELDLAYCKGTMEVWSVPCEACGQFIQPQIGHFTAGGKSFGDESLGLKDGKGKYILGKLLPLVTFDCPYCNHNHKDSPKLKQFWNANGKYIAENPYPLDGHRSFRWSSVHRISWNTIIEHWIKVCESRKLGNGQKDYINFFHQRMALSIKADEFLNSDKVVRTDKPYDKSGWADEFTRNFVIDVQKDRFFGNIRAYAKDGRARQLWCGWLDTIEQVLAKQSEYNIPFAVDRTGKRTYSVLWDSGYPLRQNEVYLYCVKYNHLAIKGDSAGTKQFERKVRVGNKIVIKYDYWNLSPKRGDPYEGQKGGGKGPTCPLIIFATDTLKKVLVQLREGKGPEWLCLSKEENQAWDDYNKGIYNEEFRTVDKNNKPIKGGRWEKVNKAVTNEAFDVETYSIGAALMAGVEFDLITNLPSNDTQSSPQ